MEMMRLMLFVYEQRSVLMLYYVDSKRQSLAMNSFCKRRREIFITGSGSTDGKIMLCWFTLNRDLLRLTSHNGDIR